MNVKFNSFPEFKINKEVFEIWVDIYKDSPGYVLINKENFLVFSKTEKTKKYLFFFDYGEDIEYATNRIFQLTGWNELFISSSASLFLFLEKEEESGLPVLVLSFNEDNEGNRISYNDIPFFNNITEKMDDIVKDFEECLISIRVNFNNLKKNDLIPIKK